MSALNRNSRDRRSPFFTVGKQSSKKVSSRLTKNKPQTNGASSAHRNSLLLNLFRQPRITFQRIGLEYPLLLPRAQDSRTVDVPPRVVEIVAGFGVDALDGTDHFRSEQDVVRGNNFGHAIDSRLVVHTRVEVHVVEQEFFERRALHVLRDAAISAPVIRHRASAMRNDEFQRRKIL